jgi:hypothetical protein
LKTYFEIECENPQSMQRRLDEIFSMLKIFSSENWSSPSYCASHLPVWLLQRFTQPLSNAEAEALMALPFEERMLAFAKAGWSLENWLYWMQPSMRLWNEIESTVVKLGLLRVSVDIDSHPSPTEALEWLFECSAIEQS